MSRYTTLHPTRCAGTQDWGRRKGCARRSARTCTRCMSPSLGRHCRHPAPRRRPAAAPLTSPPRALPPLPAGCPVLSLPPLVLPAPPPPRARRWVLLSKAAAAAAAAAAAVAAALAAMTACWAAGRRGLEALVRHHPAAVVTRCGMARQLPWLPRQPTAAEQRRCLPACHPLDTCRTQLQRRRRAAAAVRTVTATQMR